MNKDFFEQVYEIVRLIPVGKVTTYGAIAKTIGSPQSSRMVGWAMNNSHNSDKVVPAHRVVNRNGMLTGKHFFGGSSVMENLLRAEGIKIKNDKIVDFKSHFWDPLKEIGFSE
jgi:methylated-DNA-protein-cysteine methyltransferase-like protein